MYAYMVVWLHVYMLIFLYDGLLKSIYVYRIYEFMYTCVHVDEYMYMCVCVCICTSLYAHVSVHVYVYSYPYVYALAYMQHLFGSIATRWCWRLSRLRHWVQL